MLSQTRRVLYKVYGGKVYMDLKVQSTLEPHAEKFQLSNVQVDPNETGLVLPLEVKDVLSSTQWMQEEVAKHEPLEGRTLEELQGLAQVLGSAKHIRVGKKAFIAHMRSFATGMNQQKKAAKGNLLKDVFQSWPRLHHQREFERSYVSKRIQVLELGPFEVQLEGMERPAVCNVQFSPDMPLGEDGQPDVRIGGDIARRSHYLFPEQVEGGLIASLSGVATLDPATVAPYGSTPQPSPGRHVPGAGRLYTDDKIRPHWTVHDGRVVPAPPTPFSAGAQDRIAAQLADKRALARGPVGGGAAPSAAPGHATTTSTPQAAAPTSKPKTKKWDGWKL
eukprot:TRINITY_DN21060_c0_g1_i1.p2 TRINITY_DN21060_c0_g1~~TRINITY_DN21060_c0_g1_i1.p2  ORF type:complete len:334 (+),score=141.36 TRINITY_DN21060_c0_g1_i1:118-1119(+)